MIITFNEFKHSLVKPASQINESSENTYAKGLSDINEPRPSRMKAPSSEYPHEFPLFNSRNSRGGGLYIQDQMNDMLIDKYGEERGNAMFQGILNAPKHGAFFQLGDKIAREKSTMINDLGVRYSDNYFTYSYFSLWKAWMDKNGYKYVIPTPEETEAKKAMKIAAEELAKEQERQTRARLLGEGNKKMFDSKMQALRQRFGKLLEIKPDAKDLDRLKDITTKSSWSMETFVQKMANSIKDATKAARRGTAIISLIGTNVSKYNAFDLAEIFFKRALQLGAVTEGLVYEAIMQSTDEYDVKTINLDTHTYMYGNSKIQRKIDSYVKTNNLTRFDNEWQYGAHLDETFNVNFKVLKQ
jgi:hypothetical protein